MLLEVRMARIVEAVTRDRAGAIGCREAAECLGVQ
jgi:hypothetical protein